jgi:hypothetical protein
MVVGFAAPSIEFPRISSGQKVCGNEVCVHTAVLVFGPKIDSVEVEINQKPAPGKGVAERGK